MYILQGAYATIKGKMTCVAAPRLSSSLFGWSITETLTTISWGAPRSIAADKKAAVAAALEADAGIVPVAPDPYFFGKQVIFAFNCLLSSMDTSVDNHGCALELDQRLDKLCSMVYLLQQP